MSSTGAPPTGERWNVNMPAVIGVVFVFLCAVVVWVVVAAGDDGDSDAAPETTATATSVSTSDTASGATAPPETTTPAPMPSTSVAGSTSPTTAPPTTAPPTTAPPSTTPPTTAPPSTVTPTSAPGAESGAVPGDLGIADRPMRQPTCNGGYITVLASAIGDQATAESIAAVLDEYPGSNYLRTDQTCPSLRPADGGEPIYVVFLGPFAVDVDACTARSEGPADAYARRLSNDLGPDHTVECS